ncbi:helix-turn-helix domain-containing protein [Streptomyces sp. AK02-01A]|uniref:TetR/AcrR family transcriptional regulator n=1 Tax=Streptomyces sp. AK02-01A TaxID=3028648 RepID=UPI0029A9BD9F|nr:helix-turn-helix domain-containing protein [Streptomyces sp. AK02-01A]MDX3854523.1 helix-turn-helix domain containing protein [Streptomyces sp. AK02-01A]
MDGVAAREQALDAAERLFYGRGIQSVGMDDIRSASGVSLKRLYQLFPTKEQLVEAYLVRRDVVWLRRLADRVERHQDPVERILAVFDQLREWFGEPDFRGCAWINAYGELGATSPRVAARARAHKLAFKRYLAGLVTAAGLPPAMADHLQLLAEGAMVTAGIFRSAEPAAQAREAAVLLLKASRGHG